jgi:hypothetical protein
LPHARSGPCPGGGYRPGLSARETGHGRAETRTLKAAHVSHLDFLGSRQAIKISRRRQDAATGKTTRQTVYAVTSLTSAHATANDLARLVREHWSIEAHHHVRDVTFGENAPTSRTGSGPANLATVTAASKTPATCTSPKAGATTPPRRNPPPLRPRLRQKRTYTEHAGALGGTVVAIH